MIGKLKIGLLAIAAGFMFQGAAVQPASAFTPHKPAVASQHGVTLIDNRRGGVRHFGGGGNRHGIYGGGLHHRRHHFYGPRFYVAPVYSYNSGCRWLKRKALYTGSHYWWRRYQRCRNGW